MPEFNISENDLKIAKDFFYYNDIEVLTAHCRKVNQRQPTFTAVLLALEMHGLDQSKVEDILESIFIVYYAQTEVKKRKISPISPGQIKKNIEWFEEFISYYNEEKQVGSEDLSSIKFLRDDVVLDYALSTLQNMFITSTEIPREVTFSYFSLLKAIEIEAEKG